MYIWRQIDMGSLIYYLSALTLKKVLCSFFAVQEYRQCFIGFNRAVWAFYSDWNPTIIPRAIIMRHDVEGSFDHTKHTESKKVVLLWGT